MFGCHLFLDQATSHILGYYIIINIHICIYICNVNPGLINPYSRLFSWDRYHWSIGWNDYWGVPPLINKPWFINPGLTLYEDRCQSVLANHTTNDGKKLFSSQETEHFNGGIPHCQSRLPKVFFCGSRQESVGIAMCRIIRWSLYTSYKVTLFKPQ